MTNVKREAEARVLDLARRVDTMFTILGKITPALMHDLHDAVNALDKSEATGG